MTPQSNLTFDEICRRAAGRRRYNAQRQTNAFWRARRVKEWLLSLGESKGAQKRVARELGVSEATISRDVQRLRRGLWRGWPHFDPDNPDRFDPGDVVD